jgi:hypothetical protein
VMGISIGEHHMTTPLVWFEGASLVFSFRGDTNPKIFILFFAAASNLKPTRAREAAESEAEGDAATHTYTYVPSGIVK